MNRMIFLAARRTGGLIARDPTDRARIGGNTRHLQAKSRSGRQSDGSDRGARRIRHIGGSIRRRSSAISYSADRASRTPDTQDSDFPGGNHGTALRCARPVCPARVRHASGIQLLNQPEDRSGT